MTPTQRVQKGLSAVSDKFKKAYGQPGGSSSIPSQGKKDAFVELQRQKFFGDRDIPEERVLRRTRQEGGINQFKQALIDKGRVLTGTRADGSTYTVMNPNTGEPVFLTDRPGGRSVSDVAQDLAFRFGPTPREVAGDIGYGLGSIAQGFVEKGSPIMSLIKGLYEKGKDYFTRSKGIESKVPVDIYSSGADAMGGAFIGPTFNDQKIRVEQLPPILVDEKLPSEMSNEEFRNTYPFLYDSRLDNLPFKAVPNNINDQINFQKALANARVENTGLGLDSLKAAYDFARNPNLNTQYGNFSLDNVFTGNPQMNYGNTVMINGVPVDLSASIGQGGISGGLSFAFNKGGSVNKHSGLGYMLK